MPIKARDQSHWQHLSGTRPKTVLDGEHRACQRTPMAPRRRWSMYVELSLSGIALKSGLGHPNRGAVVGEG